MFFQADPPVATLVAAYYKFREGYNHLAQEALSKGIQLWQLVPKLRQSEHLFVDWPSWGVNIRHTSCSLDEDMVGRMKKVAQHTHPRTMSVRCAQHWCAMVGLRWAGTDRLWDR